MTFITVSTLLLGIACGFGATIYSVVAVWHVRNRHRVVGVWYVVLAASYVALAVVIVGRLLNYFPELPRGFSILLIAPVIAVPPAIQWFAWLKARRLLQEQRRG